jgi:hypothetical protein
MQNWLDKYRPTYQAPGGAEGTPTPSEPASGTPTPLPTPEPTTPDPSAAPVAPDAVQQRFNNLTAEKWAEKRRADAAEARARLAEETLAELRRLEAAEPPAPAAPPRPAPSPDPPGTIRLTEAQLTERVKQEAAVNEYNRRVNDMVAEGRSKHKDFDEQVNKLKSLTGNNVPEGFVVAMMETGRGADVLHALGSDLQEVSRILELPPARQVVELTRFADKLVAPRTAPDAGTTTTTEVSRAPAPISARVGGGTASRELEIDDPRAADPDKGLSTAEWMRRRNADVQKKRQNGVQIR